MCPPGAWIQDLLEDSRRDQAAVETLSPLGLDKTASVSADAADAVGTWKGPRGAGREPGELAASPEAEAALEDGAHGGGECLSLTLTTARPRPQRGGHPASWEQPQSSRAGGSLPRGRGARTPLLRCSVGSSLKLEVLLFGSCVSEQVSCPTNTLKGGSFECLPEAHLPGCSKERAEAPPVPQHTHAHIHSPPHTYTQTCTPTHVHMHTHTCTYSHTHTCTAAGPAGGLRLP